MEFKKFYKYPKEKFEKIKENRIVALGFTLILGLTICSYLLNIENVSPKAYAATSPNITVLNPIADSYVASDNPSSNYGSKILLKVDGGSARISYLKFDLSSQAGKTILSAKLRLKVPSISSSSSSPQSKSTQNVKLVSDSTWSESLLTYSKRPTISSTIISTIQDNNIANTWVEAVITSSVQSSLGSKISLAIDSSYTDGIEFLSRESSTDKPQLVLDFGVTALPTPTISPNPTTSPSPTFLPTSTPPQTGLYLPSQVLNLTNWKITLPTGPSEHPTEITQPSLGSYKIDPWFIVGANSGVRFRAPVNGTTTSGSGYPRSELREMTNNGSSTAIWSSTSGKHILFIDEAITAVPRTKKHVVAGQIHGSSDDIIVIRPEDKKLFIDINGNDGPTLDTNDTLGKRFNVKFVATGGKTMIYYNNSSTAAYTLTKSYSGAYFKVGAYTQSNINTEPASFYNSSNYGEVVVYNATVTHN